MIFLDLLFIFKVILEKGLVGIMVGGLEVGLVDVVDCLDDVVVVLLFVGIVKFWYSGFWKKK